MKKDIKVKDFTEIATGDNNSVHTILWNDTEVKIKDNLSTEEFLEIVKTVYSVCCNESTGEFVPENKEITLTVMLTNYLTNIALPKSVINAYDLIVCSSLYNIFMDDARFCDQMRRLNEAIEIKMRYFIHTQIGEITKAANMFVSTIENVASAFEDITSGINAEDLTKVIESLSTNTGIADAVKNLITDKTKQNHEE